ncbi:5149_t:CDS:2 [Acaulospora morrowiae]|uniref:5149_t:CDS:1 n=1 Tax=Acaulospora morrowiae TaxID=94023 RepID=A0A9N8YQ82_9GLOM|nr:5149_t:CDS:2 [Acaulospora morrowiae]
MGFLTFGFLGLLTAAFVTETPMFVFFTAAYPFLYLGNLFVRHKRLASAQPWPVNEKIVLITGASSGIGQSLAHVFAKRGATLILCARREDMLSSVANECRELNSSVKVLTVKCDVTDESDVARLVETIETTYGRLDCLALNAGVSMGEDFAELKDYSVIKKVMDVNYYGCTNVTYKALPLLKKNKKSRILVTNSISGILALPSRSGYAAAKFAVRGFFDSLQAELWKDEIFITLAYPGPVKTEINKNRLGDDPKQLDFTNAITSEECAQELVEGVLRGDKEVIFTRNGKLGRLMEGVFPDLTAYLVDRNARKHLNK